MRVCCRSQTKPLYSLPVGFKIYHGLQMPHTKVNKNREMGAEKIKFKEKDLWLETKLQNFQKTYKFLKISPNFTKFLQISPNFFKIHQISPNFTKFHQSSELVYF